MEQLKIIFPIFNFIKKYFNKDYLLNFQMFNKKTFESLKIKEPINLDKTVKGSDIILVDEWEQFKKNKDISHTKIMNLLKNIDWEIKEYIGVSKYHKASFHAIAPIPFLISIGYELKHIEFVKFYEFDSTKKKTIKIKNNFFYNFLQKHFKKLNYEKLKKRDIITIQNSEDVILVVSTSSRVDEENLKQFKNNNFSIKEIYLENCDFNSKDKFVSIKSIQQIDEYVDFIIQEILTLSNQSNIKKIHLILACKPTIVFKLGTKITNTYHKEIICYDFNQISDNPYWFGICVNSKKTNDVRIFK